MLLELVTLGRRSHGSIKPHRHDCQEWHFLVAGPCAFRIGDRHFRVTGGDCFVVPPGEWHHVQLEAPGDRIVQYLAQARAETAAEQALPHAFAARAGRRGVIAGGSAIHLVLAEAARLRDGADPLLRRAIEATFTAMVCRMVALEHADAQPGPVYRALDLMRLRLTVGVSVQELATFAGTSPETLTRLFRQHLGVTPSRYFLHLRLSLADELLSQPGASVAGVAKAVGFEDPFHFSRRFRVWSGHPPSHRLDLRRSASDGNGPRP